MTIFQKTWDWMFNASTENRSLLKTILWWEYRRIPYNLIIGSIGLCSLLLFYFAISQSGQLKPGEDAIEPLVLLASPIIINIAYTLGWLTEIIVRLFKKDKDNRTGPILLKLGLGFSLFVVILPSAYWTGYWLLHTTGVIN